MRTLNLRIWFWLLSLACCSCRNEQERHAEQVRQAAIAEFGLAATPQPGPRKPLDWLSWNERVLVGGYEAVGSRSARWDAPVREALRLFAQDNAGIRNPTQNLRIAISNQVHQALAAGCRDPSILYLEGRFVIPNQEGRQTEIATACLNAAEGFRTTRYHPARKLMAETRAVIKMRNTPGMMRVEGGLEAYNTFISEGFALYERAIDRDPTLPPEEAYDLTDTLLFSGFLPDEQRSTNYFRIEKRLFEYWPDHPLMWLLKARFYVGYAMQARGELIASMVTDEGWQGMNARLKIAEDALNRAWLLNSNDVRIPNLMLRVELHQGRGRERFEQWFSRAMALKPSNYNACMEKILYLSTAYYGQPGDVLKFGRECGTNTNWAPAISLVLPQAHEAVADGDDYWKNPQIWHEIQQCFERYFARKDQDPGYRHNYARFAYLCEQWDVLADQINQMGPEVNYSYFGGKNAYLGMVKKARAMSQRKIVAPGTP